MKAGLSTIQQTLTPEAASVLNRSIAEAARRNHGQTTPLHVAATLLASPTGLLRQACMSSHPNSSHPLQCRALDLCFRVALERLPSAGQKVTDTTLSNALTAALKRAQAHQRRGCPEIQQQPLLAIKVELQQLIVSILDDPSVSKVMREASFSSPAVKAVIEQSMTSQTLLTNSAPIGHRFRSPPSARTQNLYMSPRLQQRNSGQSGEHRSDEARKVIEIMMRRKKRNPILVGESEPAAVLKEVLRRIENGETGEGLLNNAEVIMLENQIPRKIKELGGRIENSNNRGLVLDLGDLKWLVDQPVSEIARATVSELGQILSSLTEDGGGGSLWLIGTASCETYLRCQVYHSSMEKELDLQAVPLASRSPLSGIIPKAGTNGTHNPNPYVNPLIHFKSSPMEMLANTRIPCFPICTSNYEQDLAESRKAEAKRPPLLPRWLQNAKSDSHKMEEDDHSKDLHKKSVGICLLIHPSFHSDLRPENAIQPQPRPQTSKILGQTVQLSTNPEAPASPVRTDLVLGRERFTQGQEFSKGEDTDAFKKLLKGLKEKSWWQKEAASELATAVTRARSGNGKRRAGLTKGDVWLMLAGPDRVSKLKMACVLAEQLCGSDPIVIQLGSRKEDNSDGKFRGKTILDRIVDAVRRNPFAVIVLENVDEADVLLRGSIKRAMERGRFTDSHGREISLGNIIFILTVKPDSLEDPNEVKYASVSGYDWQLKVSVQEGCSKRRRANWLDDDEDECRTKMTKMPRKVASIGLGLSLDLNLLAGDDEAEAEDETDISHNSNDENVQLTMTTVPHELAIHVDDTIVFKQVNFGAIRREIEKRIKDNFSVIVGKEHTIELEELEGTAVEKVVGETWLGTLSLDEWIEKVVSPNFGQLRSSLSGQTMVVRVQLDKGGSDLGSQGD